jgi:hypothetical protein
VQRLLSQKDKEISLGFYSIIMVFLADNSSLARNKSSSEYKQDFFIISFNFYNPSNPFNINYHYH